MLWGSLSHKERPCVGSSVDVICWVQSSSHPCPDARHELRSRQMILDPVIKSPWPGTSWWFSGWASACQCRGHEFEAWSGNWDPTCLGSNSYWSPYALESVLCNKRSHHNEKPVHHSWRVALTQRNWRKPMQSNQDPVWPKIIGE